jgi:hypothetical protein
MDLSLYNFQTIYLPIAFAVVVFLCAAIAFSFRKLALLIGALLAITAYLVLKSAGDRYKEKNPAPTPPTAAETEAAKAPAVPTTTTKSTPAEAPAGKTAQERAIQRYPQLGVAKSPLNQEFLRRHNAYKASKPQFFSDPEWPTKLAAESEQALKK